MIGILLIVAGVLAFFGLVSSLLVLFEGATFTEVLQTWGIMLLLLAVAAIPVGLILGGAALL